MRRLTERDVQLPLAVLMAVIFFAALLLGAWICAGLAIVISVIDQAAGPFWISALKEHSHEVGRAESGEDPDGTAHARRPTDPSGPSQDFAAEIGPKRIETSDALRQAMRRQGGPPIRPAKQGPEEHPETDGATQATAFDEVEIDHGMMVSVPRGWKMSQYRAEQPALQSPGDLARRTALATSQERELVGS